MSQHCLRVVPMLSAKIPLTEKKWANIAHWNYTKCLVATDGKHVVLQAPINSGSEYINYKSHFSIVLMATADADYNFTFVDIGCQGRISDGGVFGNTILSKKLDERELKLPPCSPLNGREKPVPYCDVCCGNSNNPKGFTQRIFNYRLNRARRVTENTFGIASSVFIVLRKLMLLEPEKAKYVVMAIVYLHNYLRRSKTPGNIYTPRDSFDTELDGAIVLLIAPRSGLAINYGIDVGAGVIDPEYQAIFKVLSLIIQTLIGGF
nr:unnamed protein product [Callosobruchus analis]